MGWSGGTSVFDTVVDDLLRLDLPLEDFGLVVRNLLVSLEDLDWDNFCESDFYDHPRVRHAVKKLYPDYFEDEDDD